MPGRSDTVLMRHGKVLIPGTFNRGFTRNSQYYTNPSTFDPERFLKETPELDPREFAFGYGRRVCPGKDLALHEVWIMVASILWAFDVVGVDEPAPLVEEDMFSFDTVRWVVSS